MKEIWSVITNPTFWVALAAVGAMGTFLVTYFTLRYHKKNEQKREISERILVPINKELGKIGDCLEEFKFPPSFEKQWGYIKEEWSIWSKIEQENPHILYTLKRQIKDELDNFSQKLKKFVYFYNQSMPLMENLMLEEIKNKLKKDSFSGGLRGLAYRIIIGGKLHSVSFYKLIFRNKTLEEYIEEAKENLSMLDNNVDDGAFIIEGLRAKDFKKEDFMELDFRIKQKISESPKLQKFVKECKRFHTEAQNLRKNLELELTKLSI